MRNGDGCRKMWGMATSERILAKVLSGQPDGAIECFDLIDYGTELKR